MMNVILELDTYRCCALEIFLYIIQTKLFFLPYFFIHHTNTFFITLFFLYIIQTLFLLPFGIISLSAPSTTPPLCGDGPRHTLPRSSPSSSLSKDFSLIPRTSALSQGLQGPTLALSQGISHSLAQLKTLAQLLGESALVQWSFLRYKTDVTIAAGHKYKQTSWGRHHRGASHAAHASEALTWGRIIYHPWTSPSDFFPL